jgi:hypothetical protein
MSEVLAGIVPAQEVEEYAPISLDCWAKYVCVLIEEVTHS